MMGLIATLATIWPVQVQHDIAVPLSLSVAQAERCGGTEAAQR